MNTQSRLSRSLEDLGVREKKHDQNSILCVLLGPSNSCYADFLCRDNRGKNEVRISRKQVCQDHGGKSICRDHKKIKLLLDKTKLSSQKNNLCWEKPWQNRGKLTIFFLIINYICLIFKWFLRNKHIRVVRVL